MSRPLLAIGAKGNYVEELQKLLNKWLTKVDGNEALLLETDKDFGGYTKEAVRVSIRNSCIRYSIRSQTARCLYRLDVCWIKELVDSK